MEGREERVRGELDIILVKVPIRSNESMIFFLFPWSISRYHSPSRAERCPTTEKKTKRQ